MEPITVAVGQRLAGRYRLEERVANGAEVEKWRDLIHRTGIKTES